MELQIASEPFTQSKEHYQLVAITHITFFIGARGVQKCMLTLMASFTLFCNYITSKVHYMKSVSENQQR